MLLLALLADIIREREFVKYFCLHNNSLSPYPWYYHSKCILFPLSLVGKHIRTHKQTSPYPEASLRTGKMCTMTGLQYIIQLDICIALSLVRVSSFVGVRSAVAIFSQQNNKRGYTSFCTRAERCLPNWQMMMSAVKHCGCTSPQSPRGRSCSFRSDM